MAEADSTLGELIADIHSARGGLLVARTRLLDTLATTPAWQATDSQRLDEDQLLDQLSRQTEVLNAHLDLVQQYSRRFVARTYHFAISSQLQSDIDRYSLLVSVLVRLNYDALRQLCTSGSTLRHRYQQWCNQAREAAGPPSRHNLEWQSRYESLVCQFAHKQLWSSARAKLDHCLDMRQQAADAFMREQLNKLNGIRVRHVAEDAIVESVRKDCTSAHLVAARSLAVANEEMRRRDLATAIIDAAVTLCERIRIPAPIMSERDRQLCMLWERDVWQLPANDAQHLANRRNLLASARQAELALIAHYRVNEHTVQDLSIQQLDARTKGAAEPDWRLADIEVDDRLIDVKNTRLSRLSATSYSHTLIKRFKEAPDGREVVYSAVLSPFDSNSGEPLVWLGETTATEITVRAKTLESGRLRIRLPRDVSGTKIPPWAFDYPKIYYAGRDEAINQLGSTPRRLPRIGCSVAAAVLAAPDLISNQWTGAALTARLASAVACAGLHRATIFLWVLSEFCDCIAEEREFPGREMFEMLYPQKHRQVPLGVLDPCWTVANLIDVCNTVCAASRRSILRSMREFQLTGFDTLRGKSTEQSALRTVISHCGECGRRPLIAGVHKWCDHCGKLICSQCGYCSDSNSCGQSYSVMDVYPNGDPKQLAATCAPWKWAAGDVPRPNPEFDPRLSDDIPF